MTSLILFVALLGRRGSLHWYDFVLLALAAAVVYADEVVGWMSNATGRALGWGALVLVECIAISTAVVAMMFLMPIYPRLDWWHPVFFVGALLFFRVATWCVLRFLGFED